MSDTISSDTSFWIKFFTDAGIPPGDATNYAITFTDHRMRKHMLGDLTKEYLNDMGVLAMGDVIAILKHAKIVHAQAAKEKALLGITSPSPSASPSRRSTPASRTIHHYIGNEPGAGPMNAPGNPSILVSDEMAARLGPKQIVRTVSTLEEMVPVPKVRRVLPEHEGKYKITMPQGITPKTSKILNKQGVLKKSSVFDRLGQGDTSTSPKVTITGLGSIKLKSLSESSGIFGRLGGKKAVKRAATSTSPDSDDDEHVEPPISPLEYQGVFKHGAKRKKIEKVEAPSSSGGTLVSDSIQNVNIKKRLGTTAKAKAHTTLAKLPVTKKKGILQRLGPIKTEAVSSTTTTVKVPAAGKVLKKAAVTRGVFSRLGKQKAE